MIADPACQICKSSSWQQIGQRIYRKSEMPGLSSYAQARYRVLFEVWFPGASDVTLTSKLCEQCGFVTYSPRPETSDLDAKYDFLASMGISGIAPNPQSPLELERARRMHWKLAGRLRGKQHARVLDFGGSDGRLVRHFAEAGHQCFVVDYSENTIDGVVRLGSTERDIGPGNHFDLIVCSHVIEHVADPVGVISRLAQRLTADGVIYIEVPMEIWGKAPLHEEPVTHVNFFVPSSVARLMNEAGLSVVSCRLSSYLHPSGQMLLAVDAYGRKDIARQHRRLDRGVKQVRGLLSPGVRQRLWRYYAAPEHLRSAIASKLKTALRRS